MTNILSNHICKSIDETVHEESRKRMPSKVFYRIVSTWNFLERSPAIKYSSVSLIKHLLNDNSNTVHKLFYRVVILLTAPQRIKQINSGIPASYVTTRQVLVGDSSIANKNKIGENHLAWSICRLQQPIPPTFSLFFFNFPSPMGRMVFAKAWTKYTGEQILVGPLLLLS